MGKVAVKQEGGQVHVFIKPDDEHDKGPVDFNDSREIDRRVEALAKERNIDLAEDLRNGGNKFTELLREVRQELAQEQGPSDRFQQAMTETEFIDKRMHYLASKRGISLDEELAQGLTSNFEDLLKEVKQGPSFVVDAEVHAMALCRGLDYDDPDVYQTLAAEAIQKFHS